MSVLFDIQGVQSPAHSERGIARYLTALSLALVRRDDGPSAYLLNPDLAVPGSLEPLVASAPLAYLDQVDYSEATVYHIGSPIELTTPLERIWPPAARRRGLRLVVTAYDLIPLVLDDGYLDRPGVRRKYLARLELLRLADRVLAISQTTADDVVERLEISPDKVVVVGAGISERFVPPSSREDALRRARERLPWLEPGFLLYTGGLDRRKNLLRLLEAYARLPSDLRAEHQLVVVCRLDDVDRLAEVDAQLDRGGIRDRVRLAGWLPDDELILLYQSCELFVFPSLYEGFGLPVGEAIACGAPVVAGRTSSVTELVPADEALFDPRDPHAIAATIERVLRDSALRARLVEPTLLQHHRWEHVAERVAQVYRELAPRPTRPRRRRRVAFVSPLPPQRSGVATYTYRLLERLTARCLVDAFVDRDVLDIVSAPEGARIEPIDALDAADRAVGGYERIVYCVGNSPFHAAALAWLRRKPGVVIAHDVRLSSLYEWTNRVRPDIEPRSLRRAIWQMYGNRVPRDVGAKSYVSLEDAERYGVLMAREVIAASERYLTHSRFAADLARMEAAAGDVRKIGVLPFATVDPDGFARVQPDRSAPLVASFGWVSRAKQSERIVDAFPHVLERFPEARLAFVGPGDGTQERHVAERAAELGIADRVTITGEVDDEPFRGWMSRTAVAVQLRAASNGESSASVAECLAAGIPTVVTAIGAARELPDNAVVKVDRDVDPSALGATISDLIADAAKAEALGAAGRAYARAHSFERAAHQLAIELFG